MKTKVKATKKAPARPSQAKANAGLKAMNRKPDGDILARIFGTKQYKPTLKKK